MRDVTVRPVTDCREGENEADGQTLIRETGGVGREAVLCLIDGTQGREEYREVGI